MKLRLQGLGRSLPSSLLQDTQPGSREQVLVRVDGH